MNRLGGDMVIRIDHTTGERETLIDASAGIPISNFEPSDTAGELKFCTASDEGMQHFTQYHYTYDLATGRIAAVDFEAGRPEVLNNWDAEHPQAYKKEYIEAEQQRLDEVWNSKR